MSTIEEVRAAEKKVQKVLEALRKAPAQDPNQLADGLRKATDAVRELK
jgi:ribosomal protein L7Ae-like RNA K-turn-binding protein